MKLVPIATLARSSRLRLGRSRRSTKQPSSRKSEMAPQNHFAFISYPTQELTWARRIQSGWWHRLRQGRANDVARIGALLAAPVSCHRVRVAAATELGVFSRRGVARCLPV